MTRERIVRHIFWRSNRMTLNAIVFDRSTDILEMLGIDDVKDWNLDAVIPNGFKFAEEVEASVGYATSPKKQVETYFHGEDDETSEILVVLLVYHSIVRLHRHSRSRTCSRRA